MREDIKKMCVSEQPTTRWTRTAKKLRPSMCHYSNAPGTSFSQACNLPGKHCCTSTVAGGRTPGRRCPTLGNAVDDANDRWESRRPAIRKVKCEHRMLDAIAHGVTEKNGSTRMSRAYVDSELPGTTISPASEQSVPVSSTSRTGPRNAEL